MIIFYFNLGGCTKYIQPGDVVWNRSFKARIGELYNTWIAGAVNEAGAAAKVRAPSFDVACQWIKTAWYALSKEMIANSFRGCGISTALDGTEDQLVTCFKLPDLKGGLEHFKQAVNEQRHVLEQRDQPEPEPEELDYESEENDDDENEILIETVANLDSQSVVLI